MAKELTKFYWVEDLLPVEVVRKSMFGGKAYYLEDKIVLVIFENEGDRIHKGKEYDFDIWNGCLFPAEREYHEFLKKKYSFLCNHPVLSKWLYIPEQTENFESDVSEILREIRRRSKYFGVIPQKKKVKFSSKKTISMRKKNKGPVRPTMFNDEPVEVKLKTANKISDLKNLGPVSEETFNEAGIKNAQTFIKLGWKKSLERIVKVDPKSAHSIFAYAMIGALSNTDWNRISLEQKKEAQEFCKKLRIKIKSKNNQ